MNHLTKLKHSIKTAALAALCSAGIAHGQSQPSHYIAPVVVSAPGANNSQWRSSMSARNPNPNQVTLDMVLHPRGQTASANDPTAQVTIPAFSTYTFNDPVAVFGQNGIAGWLEMTSTERLVWNDIYVFNQSPDGTQQGQGIPIFDADNLDNDSRIAKPGDKIEFVLPNTTTKRINFIRNIFRGTRPTISDTVELVQPAGDGAIVRNGATLDTPIFTQNSPLDSALNGTAPQDGDALRVTFATEGGIGTAYALYQLTVVDNLKSTSQDPYSVFGTVRPLLERAAVRYGPEQAEQNDLVTLTIDLQARTGTKINKVWIDYDNNGSFDSSITCDGTNKCHYEYQTTSVQTGTYTPRIRAEMEDNGAFYTRDLTGNTMTVTTAKNYTYGSDIRAKVIANKTALATLFSMPGVQYVSGNPVNPLQQLTYDQALAGINMLTDGITAPGNAEMSGIKIYETTPTQTVVFTIQGATTVESFAMNQKYLANQVRQILEKP